MSGLMARIRSRRADGPPTAAPAEGEAPTAEPIAAPDAAADTPAPAEQATTVVPAVEAEQPTAVADPVAADAPSDAQTEPAADVPMPDDVPAGAEVAPRGPSFRDRGRLRRRLRYLRRVRELGFRDLGGLVFDLHRFGKDKPELVRAKLDALAAIDRELRTLEAELGDERPVEELLEPGIAACSHCGTIRGSEAKFCPNCGRPAGSAPGPEPQPPEQPAAE